MTEEETGTLAELNVKPGDVFELANLMGNSCTLQSDGRILIGDGPEYYGRYPEKGHLMAQIISRASDTHKTWGEMTDEEKGALLLAHHEGKVIEVFDYGYWLPFFIGDLSDGMIVRVRPPEPKRDTVTLYGCALWWGKASSPCDGDTHRITFDVIDGKPDCASIDMEELE